MNDILGKIREDRKFFFAIFAFSIFTVLLVTKFIDQDGYKYLAAISFFGYCAVNVSQKVGLAWANGKVDIQEAP